MAKPIMIQGTMSNAGKSLLAAGLCRILKQDGYKVAPFKSQNMALNSFITRENLEMGRAQAVQAYACGIEPKVCMNPILLKPTTDMGSQVIVNGEVQGNMRAMDYFRRKKEYIPAILEAYRKLDEAYDIVVIEGAGSPAEINLKQDDIVNMGLAKLVDAPVLLVGDIDRGGVFAQLVGTVMLLEKEEQDRIQGLVINKFRGDGGILEPGLEMLRDRCGKKVLGVVPYMDVDIEEEDSLAAGLSKKEITGKVDIAVIRLPRISNFTDFQAFSLEKAVSVRYVEKVSELGRPDMIILPGTKNTIRDMQWLRQSGLEGAVLRRVREGSLLFGICGGYQMLGQEIMDEKGMEGECSSLRGMGLLPVITYFEEEKTRTRTKGRTAELMGSLKPLSHKKVSGYEIHMGRTVPVTDNDRTKLCFSRSEGRFPMSNHYGSDCSSGNYFAVLEENMGGEFVESTVGSGESASVPNPALWGKRDGGFTDSVMGTYLHGVFDEEEFRCALVQLLCDRKGIPYEGTPEITYEAYREQQFDKLAAALRESLDMEEIYRIIGV